MDWSHFSNTANTAGLPGFLEGVAHARDDGGIHAFGAAHAKREIGNDLVPQRKRESIPHLPDHLQSVC